MAHGTSAVLAAALVAVLGTSACSVLEREDDPSVSAFDLKAGTCVMPPKEVTVSVDEVDVVGCTKPHTQEVYAVVKYRAATSAAAVTDFPGGTALKKFADGTCAERYEDYVGIPYPDSSLFFTYLLPSARSWDQGGDRDVVCLVTTTGARLTESVRGSKK